MPHSRTSRWSLLVLSGLLLLGPYFAFALQQPPEQQQAPLPKDKPAATQPQAPVLPAHAGSQEETTKTTVVTKAVLQPAEPAKPAPIETPEMAQERMDASIRAFYWAFWVCTGMLMLLLLFMLVSLGGAMLKGKWSLGDALSEESSYQPKEIKTKADIIMVASTSRVIALMGLVGILSTVLAIGYSIVWSLFVFKEVPDLSSVRSFLYGSACLFAPYLANQLRNMFAPGTPAEPATPPVSVPESQTITAIIPATLEAKPTSQPLKITGNGFRQGAQVVLTAPDGTCTRIDAANLSLLQPTLIEVPATLATPGTWKVAVANPGANPSPACSLQVTPTATPAGTPPAGTP